MAFSIQPMLPMEGNPVVEATTRQVSGTRNKYYSRCTDCGRNLPAGYGIISKPNPKKKWDVRCANGCKDVEGIHGV